ncbi:MAG: hypothetical protein WAM14_04870 [Candidatus Nitrosopolaris sp.]
MSRSFLPDVRTKDEIKNVMLRLWADDRQLKKKSHLRPRVDLTLQLCRVPPESGYSRQLLKNHRRVCWGDLVNPD